jgi:hypothetical protein
MQWLHETDEKVIRETIREMIRETIRETIREKWYKNDCNG